MSSANLVHLILKYLVTSVCYMYGSTQKCMHTLTKVKTLDANS